MECVISNKGVLTYEQESNEMDDTANAISRQPLLKNLPEPLKERKQWVTVSQDKTPHGQWDDPKTWLTFEDALEKQLAWDCLIAYVVSDDDPFTIIDFDPPKMGPTENYFNDVVRGPMEQMASYAEWSTSGTGIHVIVEGNWPEGKRISVSALGGKVEFFARRKFVICTGAMIDGFETLKNGQEVLNYLAEQVGDATATEPQFEIVEERRTPAQMIAGLFVRAGNNERIINRLTATFKPAQWNEAAFKDAVEAWDTTDNSMAQYSFLCAMVEYTGTRDPEALIALIRESALSRCPATGRCGVVKAGGYGTALAYENLIYKEAIKALNTLVPKLDTQKKRIEHGAEVWEALKASFAKKAVQWEEDLDPIPDFDEEKYGLKNSCGFTSFLPNKENVVPEPVTYAQFVKMTMERMRHPSRSYAELAVIAILSGMIGRRYVFENRSIAQMVMVGGHSAAGKTQSQKAVMKALKDCLDDGGQFNTLSRDVEKRMLSEQHAESAQGILDHLRDAPATAWVADEAQTGMELFFGLTEARTQAQKSIPQVFNKMFDMGPGQYLSTGLSRTSKEKDNDKGRVHSASVSLYWATQLGVFKEMINVDIIASGLMSRVSVFIVDDPLQPRVDDNVPPADPAFSQYVRTLFAGVQQTDQALQNGPNPQAHIHVMFADAQVQQAYNVLCDISDENARIGQKEANGKGLSLMHSRVAMKVGSLAAFAAALDNPILPRITMQHLYWAASLIIPASLDVHTQIKTSSVGSGLEAEVNAAFVLLKSLCAKEKNGIIMHTVARNRIGDLGLVKRMYGKDKRRAAGNIIADLLDSGMIVEIDRLHPKYPEKFKEKIGRPATFYGVARGPF